VSVTALQDDLETLVLDAELLEAVLGTPDPDRKAKEIDIKVSTRLRKHIHDPRFKPLAERLEALRAKHEQGLLISIDFLKELLVLARDVVATEQASPPIEQEERGKAALGELFEDAKSDDTPIMVERVVNDIDAIVRHVRFDGHRPVRPRLWVHPRVLLAADGLLPFRSTSVMGDTRANPHGAGLLLEEVRVDSLDLVRLLDVDAEVELDHEFR
jgi:hypothetical protein